MSISNFLMVTSSLIPFLVFNISQLFCVMYIKFGKCTTHVHIDCNVAWCNLCSVSSPLPPPSQVEVDMAGVPVYSNSSKPGHTHLPRPLCRKCGSGGLMELIRCRVCCHPFHRFCAGAQESSSSTSFTCPQCITCSICGMGDNVRIDKLIYEPRHMLASSPDGLYTHIPSLIPGPFSSPQKSWVRG